MQRAVQPEPAGPHPAHPAEDRGSQTVTQYWPLTGLKVPPDKTAELHHRVLVAKMDNTVSSRPQVGLSKADMVVEELVEGGLTRLAVFYYSHVPRNVGPIRSMRTSDIAVVSPVHASMVTSGAAPKTIARVKAAHIRFYGQFAKGMYRSTLRAAPYNLFVHLRKVAAVAKRKRARTPPDYLAWGSAKDLPQGRKVTKIRAQFSAVHTTEWVFTNGRYHNRNSNAPARDQFPATNVLVLRVREGDAGYLDPAGNHVPVDPAEGLRQRSALPRRPDGRRDLAQGQGAGLHDQADHEEGPQARGPRRPHLDRAGSGPRRQRHLLEEAAARPMS